MTIVNQYPVMEGTTPAWVNLLAIVCLFVCVFILVLSLVDRYWSIAITFGCFVILFLSLIIVGNGKRETGRNCYECLIDDTVSFVEVAENYNIVGQRGELWILEDRDEISVD